MIKSRPVREALDVVGTGCEEASAMRDTDADMIHFGSD
jgi:hypothetical protein